MKLTPLDLKKQVFKKVMRGYDPVEVRTFLDMVSEEFERLIKENMSFGERIRTLDNQIDDYRKMEQTMNDALMSAQKGLAESRENAQKEAELIIRDARIEYEKILQDAKKSYDKLHIEIDELERIKNENLVKIKNFLNSQLSLLVSFQDSEGRAELVEDMNTNPGSEESQGG